MAQGKAYYRYIAAIQLMEKHTKLKEERIAALERLYKSQGKDDAAIDTLVDRDIDVNKQASKAARWAGVAAAYGAGALMEVLANIPGVYDR